MTTVVPPVLLSAREAVEPVLREAVGKLEPHTRGVCEYHFGWQNADGSPATSGGKALRPAMVLLGARSAVPDCDPPLPAAAAVELGRHTVAVTGSEDGTIRLWDMGD